MVWIPSGSCRLGPVDGFWIDACPVTNHEFAAFTFETGYCPVACREAGQTRWRHPDGRADHPVTDVSWVDAVAYAAWTGKALPTEAEWACAAHDDLAPEVAGADPGGTRPVATGLPNRYGLYDVSGAVREWTADWYPIGGPVPLKVVTGGTRTGQPQPVHGHAGNIGFRCVVRTG